MSRARRGARACERGSVSSPRIGLSERVCGAQNSACRCRCDIGIAADAEHRAAIWGVAFEIRRGRDVLTLADRVFVIICNVERDPARIAQRHDHARDQAVAAPADRAFLAVDRDPADEGALPGGAAFLIIDQHDAILRSEEHPSELQSLMRSSYAVFCLKNTKTQTA